MHNTCNCQQQVGFLQLPCQTFPMLSLAYCCHACSNCSHPAATCGQQCSQQHSSGTSTGTSSGQGPSTRPVNASVEAFLLRLTTRSSPAPAVAADAPQHTDCPAPKPDSSTADAGSMPEACAGSAHAAVACDTADVVQQPAGASSEAETDSVSDTDHAEVSQPFEAFLQEAEQLQAAAMLAAAGRHHDNSKTAQQEGGRGPTGSDGATSGAAAAAAAAGASYHARLASMLDAVEHLEQQLHQRSTPVQHRASAHT